MTHRSTALAAVFVLLTAGASSCQRKTAGITYRVTGTASQVEVTYTGMGMMSMSQQTVTSLPWQYSFPQRGPGVLSVDVGTPQTGVTLTCEILVDGRLVAQATTTGGFARNAHCNAPLAPF
jgi:hypothetical protein